MTLDGDTFPAVSGKVFCSNASVQFERHVSLERLSMRDASHCPHGCPSSLVLHFELTSIFSDCTDHEVFIRLEVSFGKAKCVSPGPTGTTTNKFGADVALLLSISERFT